MGHFKKGAVARDIFHDPGFRRGFDVASKEDTDGRVAEGDDEALIVAFYGVFFGVQQWAVDLEAHFVG